jgi:hypothetical protein
MKNLIIVMFVGGALLFFSGFVCYKDKPDLQLNQMVLGVGVMVTSIGYKYVLGGRG